jgi:hypothetical protein
MQYLSKSREQIPSRLQSPSRQPPSTRRYSSASQQGTEQTHDEVGQRILEELTGRVYSDVGSFYERYFEGKCWTNNAWDIYEESRAQYAEGRWSGWPEPSLQSHFFK